MRIFAVDGMRALEFPKNWECIASPIAVVFIVKKKDSISKSLSSNAWSPF
jgi:hypothetical protein